MGIKGVSKKKPVKKAVKQSFLTNWKTTLAGLITGAALGYAGYTTGNPELMIAGATMNSKHPCEGCPARNNALLCAKQAHCQYAESKK